MGVNTMKKLNYILAAAAVAAVPVSCSEKMSENDNENTLNEVSKVEMTFNATAPAVNGNDGRPAGDALPLTTKTQLGEDGLTVVWSEKDAISVFDGVENEQFTVSGIDGSSAVFSGLAVPTGTYYAVYPYSGTASMAEGVITAALPASQPAVQGTFGSGINLSAAVASDGSFIFRNLCALASLEITSVPDGCTLTSVTIQGRGDEALAGNVSIEVPELTSTVSGNEGVTLTGESIAAGTYAFTVHPAELRDGVVITFHYGDRGSSKVVSGSALSFKAGVKTVLPSVAAPAPESGTEASPYKLASVEDLQNMKNIIGALDLDYTDAAGAPSVYFSLVADIDMSGVEWTPVWTPESLSSDSYPVIYFDGNGHKISNLSTSGKYASFFGVLIGKCSDVVFENPQIESDNTTSAGTVASVLLSFDDRTEKSEISNVSVTGGSISGPRVVLPQDAYTTDGRIGNSDSPAYGAGGISGIMRNGSKIMYCSSTADVMGTIAGGIAGSCEMSGEITGCKSYGDVTALGTGDSANTYYAGGIAGLISGKNGDNKFWVKESYSEGRITSTDIAYSSGGIAGFAENDSWIETSYSTAELYGRVNAGGIVGSAWGTWGLTVINCVAWCKVYHTAPYGCDEKYGNGYIVGAWRGAYNKFDNCYSNSNETGLTWLNPDNNQEETLSPSDDESAPVDTGDQSVMKNRYNGIPATSLDEALKTAGITK